MRKIKAKLRAGWSWTKAKTKQILISVGIVGVASAALLGAPTDPCLLTQEVSYFVTSTGKTATKTVESRYCPPTANDLTLSQKAKQWDAVKWKLTAEEREAIMSAKKAEYADTNDKTALETKYDELIQYYETKK